MFRRSDYYYILTLAGIAAALMLNTAVTLAQRDAPVVQAIENERLESRAEALAQRIDRIEQDLQKWSPDRRLAVVETSVSTIERLLYGVVFATAGHLLVGLFQISQQRNRRRGGER